VLGFHDPSFEVEYSINTAVMTAKDIVSVAKLKRSQVY
jgi:hypothetical protein